MIGGAVVLFVAAVVLVILGISFVFDIKHKVGPVLEGATVDSRGRTYTFLRIRGEGVAWFNHSDVHPGRRSARRGHRLRHSRGHLAPL